MKRFVVLGVWILGTAVWPALGGDHFLQWRVERTRCTIPAYDYQTSKPSAASGIISETAIIAVNPPEVDSTEIRTFVFDKVTAGPATLSGLSAVASGDGNVLVSGILKHTGGDAGQLQGNKVIVRAEALTATGETAETGTVLATEETAIWVRKGRPQTLNLSLNSMSLSKVPAKVERIRLYLETHPCR